MGFVEKCVVLLNYDYDDFVVEIVVPSSKGVLSRRNGDDDGETMTRELFFSDYGRAGG